MLSAKENFLETIKKDGNPDRLVKQFEGTVFFPPSPASSYIRGNRHRGMEPLKDRFGTEILWPENQVAAMPHVTAENKVIKDITQWRDQLVMPDLEANCSDPELWKPFIEQAEASRGEDKLLMAFMPTGVFERLHFLMGFEDMLVNFLLEPEDMLDGTRWAGRKNGLAFFNIARAIFNPKDLFHLPLLSREAGQETFYVTLVTAWRHTCVPASDAP